MTLNDLWVTNPGMVQELSCFVPSPAWYSLQRRHLFSYFLGCCLPFKSRKREDLRISYPCVVLNVMVAKHRLIM